jgi:hypothetical protein
MNARVGKPATLEWEFSGDAVTAHPDDRRNVPGLHVGSDWAFFTKSRKSFDLERPFSPEVSYTAVVRASFELVH